MTAGQIVAPEWERLRDQAGRLSTVERDLLARAQELRSAVGFVAGVDANVQSALSSALYKLEDAATSARMVAGKVNTWANEIVACDSRLQTGNVPTVRPLGGGNEAGALAALAAATAGAYWRYGHWIPLPGLPQNLAEARRVVLWQLASRGGLPYSPAGRATLTALRRGAVGTAAALTLAGKGRYGRWVEAGLRSRAMATLTRGAGFASRLSRGAGRFAPGLNVLAVPVVYRNLSVAIDTGEGRTIAAVDAAALTVSLAASGLMVVGVTTIGVISLPVVAAGAAVVGTAVLVYQYGPRVWSAGTGAINSAGRAVADTAGHAQRTVAHAADVAGEAIADTADHARRTVGDAAEDVGDAVADTADHASRTVGDAAEDVGDAAGDAARRAGDRVRDGWRTLGFGDDDDDE